MACKGSMREGGEAEHTEVKKCRRPCLFARTPALMVTSCIPHSLVTVSRATRCFAPRTASSEFSHFHLYTPLTCVPRREVQSLTGKQTKARVQSKLAGRETVEALVWSMQRD